MADPQNSHFGTKIGDLNISQAVDNFVFKFPNFC